MKGSPEAVLSAGVKYDRCASNAGESSARIGNPALNGDALGRVIVSMKGPNTSWFDHFPVRVQRYAKQVKDWPPQDVDDTKIVYGYESGYEDDGDGARKIGHLSLWSLNWCSA
ncbi:MAG TPA: hypothetical protein VIF88_12015 [Methylocystis sp.]